MGIGIRIGRGIAASLYGFATLALAQPVPELEIDFIGAAPVPLGMMLSVLIAVAVATLGILALRRTRGRGRLVSWAVIALTALPLAAALTHTRLIGDAQAAFAPFPLVTSPAIIAISGLGSAYQATNQTGTPITLTAVKLVNVPNLFIDSQLTTCVPGVSLGAGGSCLVFLAD